MMRDLRLPLLLFVVLGLAAACGGSSGSSGATGSPGSADGGLLAVYRRVTGGVTEETTIYGDGRILMKHGEYLERLTVPLADIERLREALAGPMPTGAPGGEPARTLTLTDGTIVEAPVPEAGTAAAMLERLTDTHSLAEDAPAASHAGDH